MIGIIAAVSSNGIIGVDNKLPFDYPADMKYFRTTTAGSTIIMGRKTFESIGRALPKRRNIVISRTKIDIAGIETFSTIPDALVQIEGDHQKIVSAYAGDANNASIDILICPPSVWFCGGASIYGEAMQFADEIHLTVTPDVIIGGDAVRFPWVNPRHWEIKSWNQLTPGDDTLRLYVYSRIA